MLRMQDLKVTEAVNLHMVAVMAQAEGAGGHVDTQNEWQPV